MGAKIENVKLKIQNTFIKLPSPSGEGLGVRSKGKAIH
jgi:hypothetical protein